MSKSIYAVDPIHQRGQTPPLAEAPGYHAQGLPSAYANAPPLPGMDGVGGGQPYYGQGQPPQAQYAIPIQHGQQVPYAYTQGESYEGGQPQPPPGYYYPQQPAQGGYGGHIPPHKMGTNVAPPPNTAYANQKPIKPHHEDGGAGQGGVEAQQQHDDEGPKGFQDLWAAVLFIVHVGVILYLALGPGIKALRTAGATADGSSSSNTNEEPAMGDKEMTSAYIGVIIVLGAAAAWSAAWVGILLRNAENIIKAAIFGSVGSAVLGLVVAVFYSNWTLAFFCALGAAINAMWYYCIRDRIPFASMNLKCSATAILKYTGSLVLAGAMTIVQIMWTLLWTLALYGIAAQKGDQVVTLDNVEYPPHDCTTDQVNNLCSCNPSGGGALVSSSGTCEDHTGYSSSMSPYLFFILLISLFWGSLVVKNVLFCSVAGAVAEWWFDDNGKNVVSRSFFRATTTSFGSICFGSLILAVLKAMKEMLKQAERNDNRDGNNAAMCVLRCMLQCVERLMQIFNRYAMVYVATYGKPFTESGRKTWDLFTRHGFDAIINDDLAETALHLVCFVVGLLTGVVGYLYAVLVGIGGSWGAVLAAVGFFAGYFLSVVIMSVIDAGVATVFVCFCEDPQAFQQSHPELSGELTRAWQSIGYDPGSRMLAYQRPQRQQGGW